MEDYIVDGNYTEDDGVQCHSCPYIINPYEEKINVWNVFDEEHPSGHQIFLCPKCHNKRKYNV